MLTVQHYKDIERGFYKEISAALGDNLLMYCVTGSLARGEVIPGWSDIDVLIVIRRYDEHFLRTLQGTLRLHSKTVKIGVTFYSLVEFNSLNYNYKDIKTHISISLIESGLYKPRVRKPEVVLREIDRVSLAWADSFEFARFLHDAKRGLVAASEASERSVYKLLITLLKIVLKKKGIIALGYHDTIRAVKDAFPSFTIDLVTPEKILEDRSLYLDRFKTYADALRWVENNDRSIFGSAL